MSDQEKFCTSCAALLEIRDVEGHSRPVCIDCGRVVYHDPKVAATCVVERQGSVLMIQRNNQVGYGLWSMPGGYVDRGEVVEQAAEREVKEETGIQTKNIQYVASQPWPFPSSLMLGFTAQALNTEFKPYDDELEDIRWVAREELSSLSLIHI